LRQISGMRALLVLATVALGLAVAPAASAWTVTMNAQPKLKRTYHWTIEKSVSQPALTLAPGQTADVTYSVTVKSTGFTDSDWSVSGQMEMSEDPDITIGSVVFRILPEEILASHTCMPSTFPVELGIVGLQCAYSAQLPDASDRTAWMRAVVSEPAGFRSVLVPFSFTNATIEEVDECVAVTDTMAGNLGTVCVGDAPKTFTYTKTVGPFFSCGSKLISNTSSFLSNDTGATGSASADVDVSVPCGAGCTRTIGYWKTHAGFGPQADAVTPLLPVLLGDAGGAKTLNVTTAEFAVQLLKMEGSNGEKDASNGINKLYAQLLGAKLNGASGADTTSVAAAITAADLFLATHDSLSWSSLSGAEQQTVLGWMTALDVYNNGGSSVGHCG
jgi:hypothetical protein